MQNCFLFVKYIVCCSKVTKMNIIFINRSRGTGYTSYVNRRMGRYIKMTNVHVETKVLISGCFCILSFSIQIMAMSSIPACVICDGRQIYTFPVVWCPECSETLCFDCKENHRASDSSRLHIIIPVSEYMKLPSYVLKITQFCAIHKEKYEYWCKNHFSPCCTKCVVESHKECKDMTSLHDVIQNVITSNTLQNTEHQMFAITNKITHLQHDQQTYITTIKEQRTWIEKEVKDVGSHSL